jgi:hypothetical protein
LLVLFPLDFLLSYTLFSISHSLACRASSSARLMQ